MSGTIVYPGADYRQLKGKSTTLLTPLVINVHTMVGTLAGSEAWFTPSGRPYSHFGVGGSGAVRQWQNLLYRAASDLNGNAFCISIECEDTSGVFAKWTGSDVPAFAPAQLKALDQLITWLCARFNIQRRLLADSCQRDGISYHRLGIDPWRGPGCTKFSSATGKVCPGDRRIAQVRTLAAGELVLDAKEWDEMATKEEIENVVRRVLNEGTGRGQTTWAGTSVATLATVQRNQQLLNSISGRLLTPDAIADRVVAKLTEGGADIDQATVEAGVRAVFAELADEA